MGPDIGGRSRADVADPLAQISDIDGARPATEKCHQAVGWTRVRGEDVDERRLPRAVGAEQHPALPASYFPIYVGKDALPVALNGDMLEPGDRVSRGRLHQGITRPAHTTPAACSASTSKGVILKNSVRTSTVCSPSRGGWRVMAAGVPSKRIGKPSNRIMPARG